jgi:hypothetical protein
MSCHQNVKARQTLEYADMASIAAIAHFLERNVKTEMNASGVEQETAIEMVARKFKAGAGTIANILRCKNGKRRVKSVCFSLGSRIIQAAIADIEREKQRLEEDRAKLMDLAIDANPSALARAEEGLKIVREALSEMRASR